MSKNFGVSAVIIAAALFGFIAEALAGPAYMLPRSEVLEVQHGGRSYQLYVSTPPGYTSPENSARKYPTIYLNDAELFFASASGSPMLSYYNRSLEEAIVVGVSYATGDDPIRSRQRDFTPVRDKNIGDETGGGAEYLNGLKSAFIPVVESEFRSDPKRRTLAGHSFGAIFGLYVLLTEPELFENYILVSPSLWYGGYAFAQFEEQYSKSHADLKARVYFAVGDLEGPAGGLRAFDMVGDQRAFVARLGSRNYKNLEIKDEVLSGGVNHAMSFPAAYLRALDWIFPPPAD